MWEFKIGPLAFSFKNGYVKKGDCHEAHEKLDKSLDERFKDTNKRIDDGNEAVNIRIGDLSGKLDMAIGLLKK